MSRRIVNNLSTSAHYWTLKLCFYWLQMKLLSANWFVHSSVNQCLNLSKPKGYYDHILIIYQKFVDFVEVLRVIEREFSIGARFFDSIISTCKKITKAIDNDLNPIRTPFIKPLRLGENHSQASWRAAINMNEVPMELNTLCMIIKVHTSFTIMKEREPVITKMQPMQMTALICILLIIRAAIGMNNAVTNVVKKNSQTSILGFVGYSSIW